ncbi:WYL domain-containing protein [Leptodesmis sp.]|uniref:WYL domain-containing protein n=1 Tax=Leptodesmis sp. TaxID=3100501 RepID=UPI004053472F
MPKPPSPHPYAELSAFERLLVLLATLIRYPGVGGFAYDEAAEQTHDALLEMQHYLQKVANELGLALPQYSTHTLRKDLVTLRRYGVLNQRMYRWGYYLGTGVMNLEELRVIFQAAQSQAQTQGDPQTRQVCRRLEKRLRGLDLELQGRLFYPVRSHLNRTIVYSDPEEMMAKGQYRHTLFHCIGEVETAIVQGQPIQLHRLADPFGTAGVGRIQVYPLQLLYSESAWYLLFEHLSNQHLEIERVDRFGEKIQRLEDNRREITLQHQRLQVAQKLLQRGWGLYLGTPQQQQLELTGQGKLVEVKVRFFEPVDAFILEGDRRHPNQKLHKGQHKGTRFVDFRVRLPERSLNEFSRWVHRFAHAAKVLAPAELVAKHREDARKLEQLYR